MKTEAHSIHDVLAKNATSFFIPPFQRAYAWGRSEVERYFSDISRIIDSELDPNEVDKLEHFFGTLVIKEEQSGFANMSVVVDGQQRLTTTLLFLIALRDLETDINSVKHNHITKTYLINDTSNFQDKIKLKQVTKDWEAYRALVIKDNHVPGVITNAYKLFKKLIQEKKQLNPQVDFDHFIIAIHRINVAVIFLDERPFKGEDPQIIFETLNSLGKPLTLSDLIRNFVLLNKPSSLQSEVYEKIWHPKIENVLNNDTSIFFRDYLAYKRSAWIKQVSVNNTKELYQQFKEFVDKAFDSHDDFINDIVRYVKCYKWIITEEVTDIISSDAIKDKKIKELLRNIFHDIKAKTFNSLVLGILEHHQYYVNDARLGDDQLIEILEALRTYLIRRRVAGLAQGENKMIPTLCRHVGEIANGSISIYSLLTDMFYRMRLPNDDELRTVLSNINFYKELSIYSKFILGKIEENNTKVAIDFRNPKVTIEHIMPQTLSEKWKNELGDDYEDIHSKLLHNIGNLILTEFNSEIGNKSFFEKKMILKTSSLYFRIGIIEKNKWNALSIIEHQQLMISWFLNTFPLPDKYKHSTNYNINEVADNGFISPLDSDASELAEGNKPTELHIGDDKIRVKTWQDVFINFLDYLKNSSDYDFELILDNQTELFGREAIIKWNVLKGMVNKNNELSNRFKSFNGKFWDRVRNLDDDEFFIHINMSASSCISRLSNIMNKFNIAEGSVKILLRD